jgi:hypothetical protein
MADMSVADYMAIAGDRDDRGFGEGYGWIILIFLFFIAFGGFGFGGRGAEAVNLTNLERDVLNNSYNGRIESAKCCCETQKEILQSNYQTLLGFKDQQNQLAICCCDLRAEILNQNQLTRDLIQNQYIDGLRTAIVDLKTDISNKNQNELF